MSKRANHEGTFSKRKDGRYTGKIQIEGRRYQVYGETRQEAQDKLKAILERYKQGLEIVTKNYSIEDWAKVWLNEYTAVMVRPNTFLYYKNILDLHVIPTLGAIPLQKLSTLHIQKLVKEKLNSGLSPVTVKKICKVARALSEYAVRMNILLRNPVAIVQIKGCQKHEIESLTAQQVKTLLFHAKGHSLYLAILLLVTTGVRRSELCGIKWKDINFEQKRLIIKRAVVKYGGYGILIHEPKTRSSKRLLPLHDYVVETLQKHLQAGKQSEYIFSRPNGEPIYPESIYDYLKRLGKKAGVPHVNVHMLRHTAASLLLEAGENPKIVQELLGHSSIAITMDTYSHVMPGLKEQAVSKLCSMIEMGSNHGVNPTK